MDNCRMTGTVAIIQARTSSSRFPGKVLEPLLGRPMIRFMVERVRKSRRADTVLVATSTDPSDDPLAAVLTQAGIDVYRGSLPDVLGRFVAAARSRGALRVVRLTGDCPLIDADLIDGVIDRLIALQLDYASNIEPRRWPDGLDVEAMTMEALEAAASEASQPREREHVTPFLREHPERFRHGSLDAAFDTSHLRWTVDHPGDLVFVQRLLAAARVSEPSAFDRFDLLRALDRDPSLLRIDRLAADSAPRTTP
jgi:spore coat polysaccharide biosynthesis protein SpsF (cytidylyltransferase family)